MNPINALAIRSSSYYRYVTSHEFVWHWKNCHLWYLYIILREMVRIHLWCCMEVVWWSSRHRQTPYYTTKALWEHRCQKPTILFWCSSIFTRAESARLLWGSDKVWAGQWYPNVIRWVNDLHLNNLLSNWSWLRPHAKRMQRTKLCQNTFEHREGCYNSENSGWFRIGYFVFVTDFSSELIQKTRISVADISRSPL